MKKLLCILLLVLLCISSAFALDYKLDLLSFKPLYKEYTADRSRASLDFQYANVYKGYPDELYQNGKTVLPWVSTTPLKLVPFIGIYHAGETFGVLRNTFTFDSFISPISFDFSFAGSITGAMEGEIADTIGYDGNFFYGLNARVADMVSMRFGFHHHCSHYGDGTFRMINPEQDTDIYQGGSGFYQWFKYYKSESMVLALSVEPFDFVRVYGELIFMQKSTYVMPYQFSPSWAMYGAGADGVPESYGGRILNFGIELQYPFFKKLGVTKLAYHVRAMEEGKIVYKLDELAAAGKDKAYYDPDRPWEFEHTINLSQAINELVTFDVTWHNGRFILNSYFATRSSYVSVGVRLTFDGTVTLVDTAK